MDEDEFRVADRLQRKPDGLRAIGSARHDGRRSAEDQLGLIGAVGWHGDHDAVHDTGITQTVEGMLQHRATGQIDECLRRAGCQPFP